MRLAAAPIRLVLDNVLACETRRRPVHRLSRETEVGGVAVARGPRCAAGCGHRLHERAVVSSRPGQTDVSTTMIYTHMLNRGLP